MIHTTSRPSGAAEKRGEAIIQSFTTDFTDGNGWGGEDHEGTGTDGTWTGHGRDMDGNMDGTWTANGAGGKTGTVASG